MGQLGSLREVVERVLSGLATGSYAHGQFGDRVAFDRDRDQYLLVIRGWDGGRRVRRVLVHLEVIDGKVWVQRDGTERGVALDLVEAGVPRDRIVLGFKSPELRKYTEFAVA